MKNSTSNKTDPNQESEKLRIEELPKIDAKAHKRAGIYEDTENLIG